MGIIISKLALSHTNTVPFEIDLRDSDYPIAPLVFAENTAEQDTFRLRIIACIPSDITLPPTFLVEEDGNPVKVSIAGGQTVSARSFIIEYDDSTSTPEQQFTLWSIVVEYSLRGMASVDYILTRLRNIDPKTSRGTVTTVQEA